MKTNRFLSLLAHQAKRLNGRYLVVLAVVFTFFACSSDSSDELIQANRATKYGNSGTMGNYNWEYSCQSYLYFQDYNIISDTLYIYGIGDLYRLNGYYLGKNNIGDLLEDLFYRNKDVSVKSLCKCLKASKFEEYEFQYEYKYDCASFVQRYSGIISPLVEGNTFLIKSYSGDYQFFEITRFPEFKRNGENAYCPSSLDLQMSYATFRCN